MEDTNEPRLFRDKKGRLWMQRQGKYHLVSRHNGDWLPGGLSWSTRVKGHRNYFENAELLKRVVQDLARLDWEIRGMPHLKWELSRELRQRNWEVIQAETQKVLDTLRDGQYVMVRCGSLVRLGKADRSASGSLCFRKYDNQTSSWAGRRSSLTTSNYLRKLTVFQAREYQKSLRWPLPKKFPRTDRPLERRIRARQRDEETKVKKEIESRYYFAAAEVQ